MAKKPVSDETQSNREISIEQRETEGLSLGTIVRRRFFRHKAAVASLIVLFLIALLAFTSVGVVIGGSGKLVVNQETGRLIVDGLRIEGWWKYNWYENYPVLNSGGTPTLSLWPFQIGEHPFGQDTLGKDIFARVMRGIQQSLLVIALVGTIATLIGVIVGSVSGFFRGRLDSLLMRFTDVIIIIPTLVLGAVLGRTFGGNAVSLGILLGLIAWTGLARLVRAEFLSLREREFVDAARVAGASNARIIFRHILPNAIGVIVVNATLLMSAAILIETSLSYLGFGIVAPDISLGQIISEYNEAFKTRPWLFWYPGLFIVLIALAINFVGDGLRDAFDPRQRRLPRQGGAWQDLKKLIAERGQK
ncbi:MAG: ABC transporter permease subunit [Actinobacteria bacterium]|jgi:ABC-type dipeptide/oligopeptide/nickel transport system permease subunit|uniref:Oligopeptide transport system permease protein OppC n=1 Tax=freshwater metagenome TaxID=449393 RepID=A0A6J6BMG6_9ZZZZ|nr:ABC transporter permease subunit [Actinomycetota bacterium]MTA89448.1 ABC transporter permease subunit [Actinomycetota bacterium]